MGNHEVTLNHLKQLVLNEEQIAEINIDYSELLEIRFEDEVFYPIWMNQLKTHLIHFPEEGDHLFVRQYQSKGNWTTLYQHHFFQRRSNNANFEKRKHDQEYHISVEGQVLGPFSREEIQDKLKNIELLTTDIISLDGGINWLHLYQIDDFDRRKGEAKALPDIPDDQVMIPTHEDIQNRIDQLGRNFSETEAVAGLAYIGNLQTGKATEQEEWEKIKKTDRDSKKIQKDVAKLKPKPEFSFELDEQNKKYIMLFAFSVIGLLVLFATWDTKPDKVVQRKNKSKTKVVQEINESQATETNKPQRKPAAVEKAEQTRQPVPAKVIQGKRPASEQNNTIKAPPFKKVSPAKQSPFKRKSPFRRKASSLPSPQKSFDKSPSFQKVQNRNFDNGDSPVEQDPVRSQLDRETLDPEAP